MHRFLLVTLFTLTSIGAFSQAIVTDRPDQTEASSTVGKGVIQIETGFSFMTEDFDAVITSQLGSNPMRKQTVALPNTLWRVGVGDRFELRVVTQPELQKVIEERLPESKVFGLADLQVGFKVNFIKAKEGRPEVGFLSHLVMPTGTVGISSAEYGVINKLAVTHSLSETHTLAYNIGYDYLGFGNGDLFYSLSWGVAISDRVAIYIEPYGLIEGMDWLRLNADAGFTYLINENVQFDYSFGLGITDKMNYHAVGLSVRLAK